MTRRRFLVTTTAAVGLAALEANSAAGDSDASSAFERLHRPLLRIPALTSNGAKVPVAIELSHPMEPDHFITSLHVVNERDPVPSKGVFQFSPLNGQAYVGVQIRVDQGTSEISVAAECNRHGRWRTTRTITIPEGAGGCAGVAPPAGAATRDEIQPPAIRIPQLVAEGAVRLNQIIDVQLKTKHPSRTGLVVRNGGFVQDSEPLHLDRMEVFYDAEPVSRFALTSALSDNPFITFKLRVHRPGTIRVVLANNRGQRFEATHPIRFA